MVFAKLKDMLKGTLEKGPQGNEVRTDALGKSTAPSNVVDLPGVLPAVANRLSEAGLRGPLQNDRAPTRLSGLMNAPELEAFFGENFFGLGRHNGAQYRTYEALSLGQRALISRFQNVLVNLVERRQEKLNRLEREIVMTARVSDVMTAQLRLACDQLRRDIDVLKGQIVLSEDGKGWVLEALNRYQIGFNKGLREAVDFELMSL
jgi:hypothetical protein